MAKIKVENNNLETIETKRGQVRFNKMTTPGSVVFDLFFGTLNIIISVIIMSLSVVVYLFKDEIQSVIGDQFALNTMPLFYITIPILLFGILLHIYSIERIAQRFYKIYGLVIFALGFIILGIIIFMIFKYSINWLGISVFGNTSLGHNYLFYFPSILYIVYSIFIIYYSLIMMRR
ncbi:hypothetical protein [Geotoga petraea]|jgi:hypothetical protein|uniref:Uncharacterized protein n=1 Tax=Geotoga petraea TaxID=28234 RepID=A0A4Z0VWC7_9BACT|nr:hypothetical protein [Geotoga petraea]TGG86834.1 hypothetical protein E4650_09305 [Geotoga petraea]